MSLCFWVVIIYRDIFLFNILNFTFCYSDRPTPFLLLLLWDRLKFSVKSDLCFLVQSWDSKLKCNTPSPNTHSIPVKAPRPSPIDYNNYRHYTYSFLHIFYYLTLKLQVYLSIYNLNVHQNLHYNNISRNFWHFFPAQIIDKWEDNRL